MRAEYVVIILMTVILVFLMIDRFRIRQELDSLKDVLDDLEGGNLNRRILAKPGRLTSRLFFKINAIIEKNQNALLRFEEEVSRNRQVMTSLAHDVRTPLTTLIGYLDALCGGLVDGEEERLYLKTAREKAENLRVYTDTLFEWFKLGSDDYPLMVETVNLTDVIQESIGAFIPVFDKQHLKYTVDIAEKAVWVQADRQAVARIVGNLVQNVLNHSGASEVYIGLSENNDQPSLSICDNGSGIKPEDLEHIFDRLYKCDTSRSHQGNGLGLAIVKTLAERMNGRVTAVSSVGEGTCFRVFFQKQG